MKDAVVIFRFTREQKQILQAKARAAGFRYMSDYVRFILFMEYGLAEKIDQIHKKVCNNAP
jgi:hypothetical protein